MTARVLDDEIRACNVEPLQTMENTITYYDYMQNGLQKFYKIQQSAADVEFLTEKHNFRQASLELEKVCTLVQSEDVN